MSTLSDNELVRAVAVEIAIPHYCCGKGARQEMPREWDPLASWDHCHDVIDAMRAKGWDVDLHFGLAFSVLIHANMKAPGMFRELALGSATAQRRAVLLAALSALRDTQGRTGT